MLTVEIKIGGHLIECITAVNITPMTVLDVLHGGTSIVRECATYKVNGALEIQHKRSDGHRELARKMLVVVKKFKA